MPDVERNVAAGLTLSRSSLGGFVVHDHGTYIGWIHAAVGEQWNAYVVTGSPTEGDYVGQYRQDEAVLHIRDTYRRNADTRRRNQRG